MARETELRPPPGRAKPSGAPGWRRLLAAPESNVVLVLALLVVFLWMQGRLGKFAGADNLNNLFRSASLQAIIAVGELLVIITGGIDLCVGSLVGFAGMLLAFVGAGLVAKGMPVPQATAIAVCAVLAFSLALGAVHALLIQLLRLPPFVVTLASMSMLRSGAYLLNNQVPIPLEQFDLIKYLGNGTLYVAGTDKGLPVAAIILLVVAISIGLLLSLTPLGRRVYSVGSNAEAARLSGVSLLTVRIFVYAACTVLAGITGILYAGYGVQGDPQGGLMYELNAISAAVIGGALLTGGRGSVVGAVLGAVLLESILSTINFTLSNPSNWVGMVVGGVLLLAVVINQLRQMRVFSRRRGPS